MGTGFDTPRTAARLVLQTARSALRHNVSMMAAGLSFYALISLAPLAMLLVAAAGALLEPAQVERAVEAGLQPYLGSASVDLLGDALRHATRRGPRLIATLLGTAVLLYGAMRVFSELQRALFRIWHGRSVPPDRARWLHLLQTQLASLLMVGAAGALWVMGFVSSVLLSETRTWLEHLGGGWIVLAPWLRGLAAAGLLAGALTLVYRYLPGVRVRLRAAAVSGVAAALLIHLGQRVAGFSVGYSAVRSLYGATGSIVIVIAWFYYSWLILLFGAEFSKAYHRHLEPRRESAD